MARNKPIGDVVSITPELHSRSSSSLEIPSVYFEAAPTPSFRSFFHKLSSVLLKPQSQHYSCP